MRLYIGDKGKDAAESLNSFWPATVSVYGSYYYLNGSFPATTAARQRAVYSTSTTAEHREAGRCRPIKQRNASRAGIQKPGCLI
jgi:hypothetical protein